KARAASSERTAAGPRVTRVRRTTTQAFRQQDVPAGAGTLGGVLIPWRYRVFNRTMGRASLQRFPLTGFAYPHDARRAPEPLRPSSACGASRPAFEEDDAHAQTHGRVLRRPTPPPGPLARGQNCP